MELEEKEKKAAELEASRIQAAAELLLKQEEDRKAKDGIAPDINVRAVGKALLKLIDPQHNRGQALCNPNCVS